MEDKLYTGIISFVHHQKYYATIDYKEGEKKKTINFQTDVKDEAKTGVSQKDKKHYFRTGDTVNFQIKLTPRGDRLNAYNVKFLYNNELDKLLQQARTNNLFKGFLKMVDDTYFVKELHSYLFFPIVFSPWENKPPENTFNEAFEFGLVNMDKQNIAAELANPSYIPAYRTALKYYRDKTVINATVTKVSQYAVYIDVIGKEIKAKLPVTDAENASYKPGYKVNLIISYLSNNKIAVEKTK
ncbi:hypothetical protein BH10BAC3_BH10BAC3_30300 [soil metagenome]